MAMSFLAKNERGPLYDEKKSEEVMI